MIFDIEVKVGENAGHFLVDDSDPGWYVAIREAELVDAILCWVYRFTDDLL